MRWRVAGAAESVSWVAGAAAVGWGSWLLLQRGPFAQGVLYGLLSLAAIVAAVLAGLAWTGPRREARAPLGLLALALTTLALSMSPAANDTSLGPDDLSDNGVWEFVDPFVDPVLEP